MTNMQEEVFVDFKKKYRVERAKFNQYCYSAIKENLPFGWKIIYSQASVTTESQYYKCLNGFYILDIRISSHRRGKYSHFHGLEFITGNYDDFETLIADIKKKITESEYPSLNLKIKNRLTVMKIIEKLNLERITLYKTKIRDQKFIKVLGNLIEYKLVILENDSLRLSSVGKSLVKGKLEIISQLDSGRKQLIQQILDQKAETIIRKLTTGEDFSSNRNLNVKEDSMNIVKGKLGTNFYSWFIPKRLIGKISVGDEVCVLTRKGTRIIVVEKMICGNKDEVESPVIKIVKSKEEI